uniref:Uncharacterized protein n=1 Tax=Acrobeloides nanus TaxID=290746 RepID=A0A914EMD0_9BILA
MIPNWIREQNHEYGLEIPGIGKPFDEHNDHMTLATQDLQSHSVQSSPKTKITKKNMSNEKDGTKSNDDDLKKAIAASISSIRSHEILIQQYAQAGKKKSSMMSTNKAAMPNDKDLYRKTNSSEASAFKRIKELEKDKKKEKINEEMHGDFIDCPKKEKKMHKKQHSCSQPEANCSTFIADESRSIRHLKYLKPDAIKQVNEYSSQNHTEKELEDSQKNIRLNCRLAPKTSSKRSLGFMVETKIQENASSKPLNNNTAGNNHGTAFSTRPKIKYNNGKLANTRKREDLSTENDLKIEVHNKKTNRNSGFTTYSSGHGSDENSSIYYNTFITNTGKFVQPNEPSTSDFTLSTGRIAKWKCERNIENLSASSGYESAEYGKYIASSNMINGKKLAYMLRRSSLLEKKSSYTINSREIDKLHTLYSNLRQQLIEAKLQIRTNGKEILDLTSIDDQRYT